MYQELYLVKQLQTGDVLYDAYHQNYYSVDEINHSVYLARLNPIVGSRVSFSLKYMDKYCPHLSFYYVGTLYDIDKDKESKTVEYESSKYIKRQAFKCGDVVRLDNGTLALVAQVHSKEIQLIRLDNGNRWSDAIPVSDVRDISYSTLSQCCPANRITEKLVANFASLIKMEL